MNDDACCAGAQPADPPCAGAGGLVVPAPIAPDPGTVAEVKAYLRVDGSDEDALIGRLLAAAIGHCEAFVGQLLLVRAVDETVMCARGWQRLGRTPVGAITAVAALPPAGDPVALAVGTYAVDIDAAGDGWVRFVAGTGRARVSYTAGLAAAWTGLPEPLRQGIVRLASHLYAQRDAADEGAPPLAVAALWRPWRRMRFL